MYGGEGPREHASWKGVPIVILRHTLATVVREIIAAGLRIEVLIDVDYQGTQAVGTTRLSAWRTLFSEGVPVPAWEDNFVKHWENGWRNLSKSLPSFRGAVLGVPGGGR
jgi:hypothetical protein